jgi:hypothetical protein
MAATSPPVDRKESRAFRKLRWVDVLGDIFGLLLRLRYATELRPTTMAKIARTKTIFYEGEGFAHRPNYSIIMGEWKGFRLKM